MKRYIPLAFILALCGGCETIKDDLSDCGTDNNCVVLFRLDDNDGRDILTRKVTTVDALLYDAGYRLAARRRVDREAMETFQGVRFTTEPGTYYIVCWGNVTGHCTLNPGDPGFTAGSVLATAEETGSPLYYGPLRTPGETVPGGPEGDFTIHRIEVPGQGTATETIRFCRAHRTLHVYLNGFAEVADPVVRIDEFAVRYDFFLRTFPTLRSYRQRAVEQVQTPDGPMKHTAFHVPISPFRDEMEVRLSDGEGQEPLATRNIKRYVDANAGWIEDLNELHILLSMNHNGEVTITAPDWGAADVRPVW